MSLKHHITVRPPIPGCGRGVVRWIAGLLTACVMLMSAQPRDPSGASPESRLTNQADEQFLEEMQARSLLFFLEHSDPQTGLTRDRAPANGAPSQAPASIAATGFALTAFCIGDYRGWISHEEVVARTVRVLRFIAEQVEHERGWIYHYINIHTGRRMWNCEASTIDTALFLKGALLAREYLNDPTVTDLVNEIYGRIDWTWAMNGGPTLSHGWRPETGFIKNRWDSYSELLGMYLLGIGAPSNPLPASSWHAWRRSPVVTYGTHTFIQCPPLFTHQFAHAWFDFRGRRDDHANYWKNSVDATLAQREWCADNAASFAHWSRNMWGVTASDSAKGYVAWGGPQGSPTKLDGTLVPCAPAGSLPFAPSECVKALREMRKVGGPAIWQRYGFVDAFNPVTGWVASDVIAIDVGISLIMAENTRSGFTWKYFMKAPEVSRGMALAGFHRDEPSLPSRLALASTDEH
jgi:hypothetical protein